MKDYWAKEAERLQKDDTLKHAMNRMRAEAYELLSEANADDKTEILRLQQRIAVLNDFTSVLAALIREGPPEPEIKRGLA